MYKFIKDFEIDHKALFEAIKEALRLGIFAFASTVVAFALERITSLDQSQAIVILGTLVLRMVDKYLHSKSEISKGWDGESHGLVRF